MYGEKRKREKTEKPLDCDLFIGERSRRATSNVLLTLCFCHAGLDPASSLNWLKPLIRGCAEGGFRVVLGGRSAGPLSCGIKPQPKSRLNARKRGSERQKSQRYYGPLSPRRSRSTVRFVSYTYRGTTLTAHFCAVSHMTMYGRIRV